MVTLDKTLLLQIINMIVLMFLLNKMLYKPVKQILKERAVKLQGMRDDADGFEQRAAQRQQEVDARMAEASGKAKVALDAARDEAQKAGDARLEAMRDESEEMKEKKLAELKSEIKVARSSLDSGVEGFAKEMAGKIMGRSL
jgi:F-type H+-transporting ATPase subunit b